MNEAQSALFDEIHEDFHEKTKVLYTYEITEEIEDFSKDVSVTQNAFNVLLVVLIQQDQYLQFQDQM